MAIPTPRSYEQILADILDGFFSKTETDNQVKIGGPLLSLVEAMAQSQLKSAQDTFNMLSSTDINKADIVALREIAKSENVPIVDSTLATGFVTIYDTSFSKISTNIYSGVSAVNPGATVIKVVDASLFPDSGNIYIGRKTSNYEGPLEYVGKALVGNYWELTLATNTVKFHNTGESVILAQGGVREIQSDTIVQTLQGNADDAVGFSLLYSAKIEDGEVEVTGVEVVAKERGTIGNVPANAIKEVVGTPFIGAKATNPLPFTNGLPDQDETSLRDAIKKARQNRTKGTDQALLNAINGVSSPEENKTVIGSSLINRKDIYIDDGLGYEEAVAGISQEVLTNSALGTEQFFQLQNVPVAKAFLKTELEAPFNIIPGQSISFRVGGKTSSHTFASADFKDPSNATAYEIVASINSNSSALFNAKTSDQAKKVCVFGKAVENEDIELVLSDVPDANVSLGFPAGIQYTLRLYKNDQLLYKDGNYAILEALPQTVWEESITDGDTLLIQVDGKATQTITVNDIDFIKYQTDFNSVKSTNTPASWAKVLNKKIIGTTVNSSLNTFYIESSLGTNTEASLKIIGGTLVNKGMFTPNDYAQGASNDYALNRNTGQIKLNKQLSKGDSLVASTTYTRAYTQGSVVQGGTVTLNSPARLWFTVDSIASIIPTPINSSTTIGVENSYGNNILRIYTSDPYDFMFGTSDDDAVKIGDWMIVWDPNTTLNGIYRVSNTAGYDQDYSWVEVGGYVAVNETFLPTSQGIAFVRSAARPFEITIPSGTYSLFDIKNYVNQNYKNIFSDVYKNTQLRFQTNTFNPEVGSVLLVSMNTEAYKLLLELDGELKTNSLPHLGYVESGNSQLGTPRFKWDSVQSKTGSSFTLSKDLGASAGDFLFIAKPLDSIELRDSFLSMYTDSLASKVSNTYTPRVLNTNFLVSGTDRLLFRSPFSLGPDENLSIVLDKDQENKKYEINLFKNAVFASGTNYGGPSLEIRDVDNGQTNFYNTIGNSTNYFNDFSFNIQAKGKSNSVNANKTILWRAKDFGANGNYIKLAYVNPTTPSSPLSLTTDSTNGSYNINIRLPSGSARTGLNLNNLNYFNVTGNISYTSTLSRTSNVVTATLVGSSTIYDLSVGDYIYQTTSGTNFPKGPKKITNVSSTTFNYAETGTDGVYIPPLTYSVVPKPTGFLNTVTVLESNGTKITATIGAHQYSVGDIVYFSPGAFDSTTNVSVIYGNKTITEITSTTISWLETTTSGTAILNPALTYTISPSSATRVTVTHHTSQSLAGNMTRASNIVSVSLTLLSNISQHPYNVGDIVYLTTNETNFLSGPKIITSKTATAFTYYEGGANATSTINHTFSSTATPPNFNSVVVGDIVNIVPDNVFAPSSIAGTYRVTVVKPTSFSFLILGSSFTSTAIPQKLNSVNNLNFYPINTSSSKASDVVTWITNNAANFVTAKLVPNNGGTTNDGSGVISLSTLDEYLGNISNASVNGTSPTSVTNWSLFDGVNFVNQTTINSTATTITLKTPVSGELISNADTENDQIKLVPITTQGLIRYLSDLSVSGLAANAVVTASNNGNNLQISSKKIGSDGAVQVLGGSANSAYATVVGSGVTSGNYGIVKSYIGQMKGFNPNSFVEISNSSLTKKVNSFNSSTTLQVEATSDSNKWRISSTGLITIRQTVAPLDYARYQVEKHGDFVAYIDNSTIPIPLFSTIVPGDWVNIKSPAFSNANSGLKQVVSIDIDKKTFWVKNPEGVSEVINSDELCITFISYDSPIIGDVLSIGSNKFNALNIGNFPIIDFVYTLGEFTAINPDSVIVSGNMIGETITLGSDYLLINFTSNEPLSLVKLLKNLVPSSDGQYVDFVLDSSNYIEKFTSSAQATIKALGKLDFNININVGADGYKYNTGLLAEVNKVLYGDESNPTIYPGFVAAGADINISGCIIKRISIGLAIKTAYGNNDPNLVSRVKSTVASIVNSTIVGQSIAISDIVSAVNNINGIISVVIIYPEYNTINDFIALQPNEKPKILDLDQDIFITFN